MIGYKLEIKGFREFEEDLKRATDRTGDLMMRAMERVVVKIEKDSQVLIRNREAKPVGGTLLKSVAHRVDRRGKDIRGEVGYGGRAKAYAYVFELGRPPGKFPPIEPLERWAKVKLGKSGLGFVIARKIAEKGYEGRHFLRDAVNRNVRFMEWTFGGVVEEIVKGLSDG